jgi:signal-transduction protein with cAMP-binding, CBS, and nucleotidyltransferase domain
MSNSVMVVFVAVAAVAIVLQLLTLFALYTASKKTSQRVEALAKKIEDEALPTLTAARTLLTESGPKIQETIANLQRTSAIVREKAERISVTADVAIDRARLQIIRADELVTRSLAHAEETTETLNYIVNTPLRHVTAILSGIFAGLSEFTGGRKVRRTGRAVPNEEMFI